MFQSIQEFINTWQSETENTQKLLEALKDESLTKAPIPGMRNIGQLVWHIIKTNPEMLSRTGLLPEGPKEGSPPPTSTQEFVTIHRNVAESLLSQIQEHWTDEDLTKTDDMYGETWTRSTTLQSLINHLIHHRGQLTIMMRIAGLKVPGIYGPAKEEWQQYGMPVPSLDD